MSAHSGIEKTYFEWYYSCIHMDKNLNRGNLSSELLSIFLHNF